MAVVEYPQGSMSERTIERRAIEAVIWGMPAVNYDRVVADHAEAYGAVNISLKTRGY